MTQFSKHNVPCRLRTGDEVVITSGKSKGQKGKIDRIDLKNQRVYIGGANIYKRHTKPGGSSEEGGILDKVMPVHVSNVMLVDSKKNKPTRLGYKKQNDKKVRFTKVSGTILDK